MRIVPYLKLDLKNLVATKGQLISECLFGFLNFPKNQQKIWQISAPETTKWSNQQHYCKKYLWKMLSRFHAYFFRIFWNDTLIFSLFIGLNTISLDPKFLTVLISIFLEASFCHYFINCTYVFFVNFFFNFLIRIWIL